eukprot:TRINITY_DN81584_c0_g1_i1.p1 TRINITY_DN81584_c0_g1~~TRINITY_DN81584_c0_g1_i1.p1  ORF type:complete len:171 (-),score=38.52 TRINITY_DN81584_c0_g1_i1:148-594(-)
MAGLNFTTQVGDAKEYANRVDGPANVLSVGADQEPQDVAGNNVLVSDNFAQCVAVVIHNDDNVSGKIYHIPPADQQDGEKCRAVANEDCRFAYLFGREKLSAKDEIGNAFQGLAAEERFDQRGDPNNRRIHSVYYKPSTQQLILFMSA